MAVTILQRPRGYILESTSLTGGDATQYSSNNWVLINVNALHGLVNGDVVYITSDIENYNGFWIVEVTTATAFLIYNEEGSADRVEYVANTLNLDVYKSTLEHGWSCVHLPITYKLSNNLYPVNSSDTTRNINSVQDANGYTVLQLSGSLGSVHSYDFVKITVPNDTDLSGVYQIIEFISPTVMIINLVYEASNNFTSATAIKQYNNYTILVRVYAGLNASHTWTAQKPYELAATLEFTPDSDNEIFFSVNEILKSYIETRNNLVLGTLPTNIDFFSMFYIETAEKYDDSDGYTFGSLTSSFTSDQGNFEGYAGNAKLEFKNIYSGYLSEYFMDTVSTPMTTTGNFLTLFDELTFNPNYFDVSFIVGTAAYKIKKLFYTESGGYIGASTVSIADIDGLIRLPIDDVYPVIIFMLYNDDNEVISEQKTIRNLCQFTEAQSTSFNNSALNSGLPLNFTSPPNDTVVTTATLTRFVTPEPNYKGTVTWNMGIAPFTAGDLVTIILDYLDATLLVALESHTIATVSTSGDSGSFDLPVPEQNIYGFRVRYAVHNVGTNSNFTGNVLFDGAEFPVETHVLYTSTIGDCCDDEIIDLTWLNNLGGFEYFRFNANKDHIREIQEVITTKNNILPSWPKSYGADADTIRKQTKRVSNKAYTIRSQHLTTDQVDAISFIKSSILVQILVSRYDRRTVIVDTDSFIVRKDGDDTKEISFNVSFTDDIPVQSL